MLSSDARLRIVVQHPIQQIACLIRSLRKQRSRLLRLERLTELDIVRECLHFLQVRNRISIENGPVLFLRRSKQVKNRIQHLLVRLPFTPQRYATAPRKSGARRNREPKMHPTDQISTAVVYNEDFINTSGAR